MSKDRLLEVLTDFDSNYPELTPQELLELEREHLAYLDSLEAQGVVTGRDAPERRPSYAALVALWHTLEKPEYRYKRVTSEWLKEQCSKADKEGSCPGSLLFDMMASHWVASFGASDLPMTGDRLLDIARSLTSYMRPASAREMPAVAPDAWTEEGTTYTSANAFSPTSIEDARKRTERAIVQRQGQGIFRSALLRAYGNRCAITGCNAVPVLEAAHIIGYKGPETNHVSNGLLLRADIHTLFDLGLLGVDTRSMSVLVAPSLAGTVYGELAGKPLQLPEDLASRPSRAALDRHRAEAKL